MAEKNFRFPIFAKNFISYFAKHELKIWAKVSRICKTRNQILVEIFAILRNMANFITDMALAPLLELRTKYRWHMSQWHEGIVGHTVAR